MNRDHQNDEEREKVKNNFLNFLIKSFGCSNLLLLLVANRNLADLDLVLSFTSLSDGLNTLFLYSLNKDKSSV